MGYPVTGQSPEDLACAGQHAGSRPAGGASDQQGIGLCWLDVEESTMAKKQHAVPEGKVAKMPNRHVGFTPNGQIGKSARELEADAREANAEARKRTNNRLDTEDQAWRTRNSHEARSRLN